MLQGMNIYKIKMINGPSSFSSDYPAFFYILYGSASVMYQGGPYPIGSGAAFFSPANIDIKIEGEGFLLYAIVCDAELFLESLGFSNPGTVFIKDSKIAKKAVEAAVSEYNKGNFNDMYLSGLFLQFVSQIDFNKRKHRAMNISDSKTFIQNNFSHNLSVSSLACMCGCDRSHYSRAFHKLFNTSPSEYILSVRLENAKKLLSSTALPVGEIAQMCGISDRLYFSKLFKLHTNLSPLDYRRGTQNRRVDTFLL